MSRFQVMEVPDALLREAGPDRYAVWDLAIGEWARHEVSGRMYTRETYESAESLCASLESRPLTASEMKGLDVGDILQGQHTNQIWIVSGNYGARATAVCSADITNPGEFKLLRKARRPPGGPGA